jgi:hypothetical protein
MTQWVKSSYEMLRTVSSKVPVFWIHRALCGQNVCVASVDDTFLYRDAGHLSVEGSILIGRKCDLMGSLLHMAR